MAHRICRLRHKLFFFACVWSICDGHGTTWSLSSSPIAESMRPIHSSEMLEAEQSTKALAHMMLAFFAAKYKTSMHASHVSAAHHSLRPVHRAAHVLMRESEELPASTQFDILEFREFRRGTLLKYGAGFRAQQLRALFFASSAVVSAFFPFLYKDLFPGSDDIGIPGFLAATASSLICGLVAKREKELRGRTLLRMDREAILGDLSISQPENSLRSQQVPVKSLRGNKRLVAVYGTPSVLLAAVQHAKVYQRRLAESGIALVAIVSLADDDANSKEKWEAFARAGRQAGWLWQPGNSAMWNDYFNGLLSGSGSDISANKGAWAAISLTGQSCASGVGPIVWDELLGTKLQPLAALSPAEPTAYPVGSTEESLLSAQKRFYDALSASDAARISSFFLPIDDEEVTALVKSGRLDGWPAVIGNNATVGIQLSSQDVTIDASGKEAFTTGIEFPQGGDVVGTLLCTQRWVSVNRSGRDSQEWRVAQHRTIPYMVDIDAPACLRCDHRGCTALQRAAVPRGPAGMPGDGRA